MKQRREIASKSSVTQYSERTDLPVTVEFPAKERRKLIKVCSTTQTPLQVKADVLAMAIAAKVIPSHVTADKFFLKVAGIDYLMVNEGAPIHTSAVFVYCRKSFVTPHLVLVPKMAVVRAKQPLTLPEIVAQNGKDLSFAKDEVIFKRKRMENKKI